MLEDCEGWVRVCRAFKLPMAYTASDNLLLSSLGRFLGTMANASKAGSGKHSRCAPHIVMV